MPCLPMRTRWLTPFCSSLVVDSEAGLSSTATLWHLHTAIKGTLKPAAPDALTIGFDYEGEVTAGDACEILEKIVALHRRAIQAAEGARTPDRAQALRLFATNLEKAFYSFEPDFFQQNLLRIVDDVVGVIKGSIQLWPSLVEIAYFEKRRHGLPKTRVANQKKWPEPMRM